MQRNPKIVPLDSAAVLVSSLRQKGKKIVLCHGVFDLLHIGHIRHFEQAKKMGDVLIVTLTPDRYVNKGPHRPAFVEDLRAEAVAALDCADYVAVNQWPTAVETIKLLRPHYFVKGADYRDSNNDVTGNIVEEETAINAVGGEITYTNDIVFSSSSLINRYLSTFPETVQEYLSGFSRRYPAADVLQFLQDARSTKVLIIGETIIDEYQYCEPIGKPAKEPILATSYVATEKFAGGVAAMANHVANFCDNVGILTMLGARDSQEEFVRQSINLDVERMFLYKEDSPTIVKRRFVDNYLLQKLFEVYEMNDDELNETQSRQFCSMINEVAPQYDVVIVGDYGHGMFTKDVINTICKKARFLVVNTQTNAGNRGMNTISRYPRADYVCLTEGEIRLEERNRKGDLREMVLSVSKKLRCDRIVVTRGSKGMICYNETGGFVEVPAFAQQVVDRMGAGDAVLSLTSLCVQQHAPMEVVGFIGNVAGAQAVATIGHQGSIERTPLFKHIESLLK